MRIFGIDPGIATIGFAALDFDGNQFQLRTCGVIKTPAHTSLSSRLNRIYTDLEELIRKFQPDSIAIEELFLIPILQPGLPLHMAAA